MDVEKTIEQMLEVQTKIQADLTGTQAASQAHFARMEAIQAKMQEDQAKADARHAAFREEFWSNMTDLHEKHVAAMKRMDRAEARMDRFDKQLQATRKLVEGGIKFVTKLAVRQSQDRKEFDRRLKALVQKQDQLVERLLHPRPNGRG